MRKLLRPIYFLGLLFVSCSEDTTVTPENAVADLTLQRSEWKTATLTNEIITNQQSISHYEFDATQLSKLIAQEEVTYVWFDLGLNTKNQITFSARGFNKKDLTNHGEITSEIIPTTRNITNIDILQQTKGAETGYNSKESHIISNEDAYNYIFSMNNAYNYDSFEKGFTKQTVRVERIGFGKPVIQRILNTKDSKSIALFLGINKQQEIITILIAKDKNGNLIIDNSNDIETSGRAFDHGGRRPPPPHSNCGGCAEYCESPFWMCCVAEPPCGGGDL
ncbi:hypothetical protein [uncultured Dokdonia sp.]|uniref:hypothetical protein n=1 Tax=uncultured Dokdonia sp. TaxID=575653 RepID=UPI0026257FCF|nr:hypothetical protein [uncultured Dokdonia sp.]